MDLDLIDIDSVGWRELAPSIVRNVRKMQELISMYCREPEIVMRGADSSVRILKCTGRLERILDGEISDIIQENFRVLSLIDEVKRALIGMDRFHPDNARSDGDMLDMRAELYARNKKALDLIDRWDKDRKEL